ncbi:MAG: HdeD family acid-resistance protein [Oscillospiraceae bacterium]
MRTLFDVLSRHALVRAVLDILLGLAMLIFPQPVIQAIVYLLAAYAAVVGIIGIVQYIRNRQQGVYELVVGILLVILAALMVAFTRPLVSVLPFFIGALLVIAGAFQAGQAIQARRVWGRVNVLQLVLGVLVIAGGVVGIVNPFASLVFLFRVFGGVILVMGVNELLIAIAAKRAAKLATQAEQPATPADVPPVELPPTGPQDEDQTAN